MDSIAGVMTDVVGNFVTVMVRSFPNALAQPDAAIITRKHNAMHKAPGAFVEFTSYTPQSARRSSEQKGTKNTY